MYLWHLEWCVLTPCNIFSNRRGMFYNSMMKALHKTLPALLTISPFLPQDQDETKQLILEGMKEHWGQLDYSKNPDLEDIQTSYGGAQFLVARLEGKIVGCGALVTRAEGVGEIVRMSVSINYRRLGIGGKILQTLVDKASSLGIQKIILETTSTWQEVMAFYRSFGFKITHKINGDTYFLLEK